jgi:hypothetical protein
VIPFPFQQGGFGRSVAQASGVAPVAVTWNPLDRSSQMVLSSGDMIATHNPVAGHDMVRATLGRSTGKFYFEVEVGSGTLDSCVGVAGASDPLEPGYVGEGSTGYSYYQQTGLKIHNASTAAYGSSWSGANRVGVAVDLGAGLIWYSLNGTWQASGDPAAGTNHAFSGLSGTYFPAASLFQFGVTARLRAKASDLIDAVPSGFSPWDAS